jgi:hypothetical protein
VPDSVRVAFYSFSDINDPETYEELDERLLLQAWCAAPANSKFNFTEWWKITEGESLSKVYDIGDELVAGLLQVLEMVRALFYT